MQGKQRGPFRSGAVILCFAGLDFAPEKWKELRMRLAEPSFRVQAFLRPGESIMLAADTLRVPSGDCSNALFADSSNDPFLRSSR